MVEVMIRGGDGRYISFLGCCNKIPQIVWLKAAAVYSLMYRKLDI